MSKIRHSVVFTICAALLSATAVFAGTNESVAPFLNLGERGTPSVTGLAPGAGSTITVSVGGRDFNGVTAVHLDLQYDREGLRFESFEAGDLFDDPIEFGPFVREEKELVDITTATISGAVSREEAVVGHLTFTILDPERTDVNVVSFETGDASWEIDSQISYDNPLGLSSAPLGTRLLGNTPNPFNPTTSIAFELSARTAVKLEIYSVNGRLVNTLVSAMMDAGAHEVTWTGKDASGDEVSSGVYFYRLNTKDGSEAKRMTLIR